jgi:hypothetical protein
LIGFVPDLVGLFEILISGAEEGAEEVVSGDKLDLGG